MRRLVVSGCCLALVLAGSVPDAQGKETEPTKSEAEAAPTTAEGTSSADSGTKGDDADSKGPSPIKGVAELHTHMFAEFAYDGDFVHGTVGLEGGTAAAPTGWAAPIHDALHECSGGVDHATLRPTIGRGLGTVSEMLTSVKTFDGEGIASTGDTGMHYFKKRGYELDSLPYIAQQGLQDALLDAVDPWSALESLAGDDALYDVILNGFQPLDAVDELVGTTISGAGAGLCRGNGEGSGLFCNAFFDQASCEGQHSCEDAQDILSLQAVTECNSESSVFEGTTSSCESAGFCGSGGVYASPSANLNACAFYSDTDPDTCAAQSMCVQTYEMEDGIVGLQCNDIPNEYVCESYSECSWSGIFNSCVNLSLSPFECNDLSESHCGSDWAQERGCGWRECSWNQCQATECVWEPVVGEHFEDWPSWDTPSHQQHWWGHVKDAHTKGLRILGVAAGAADPLNLLMARPGPTPVQSITLQLEAAQTFAAAHDWVQIATSPQEARNIAAQGKLAMVLSVEASYPFCSERPCGSGSDEEDLGEILSTLDGYEALGVRSLQIAHQWDNTFAGAAIHQADFPILQWLYQRLNEGPITQEMFDAARKQGHPTVDEMLYELPMSDVLAFIFPNGEMGAPELQFITIAEVLNGFTVYAGQSLPDWLQTGISELFGIPSLQFTLQVDEVVQQASSLVQPFLQEYAGIVLSEVDLPESDALFPIETHADINDVHMLLAKAAKLSDMSCAERTGTPGVLGEARNCVSCIELMGQPDPVTGESYTCDNTRGLSTLGEQFVNALIDRGIMIDVAHLSTRGVLDVRSILKRRGLKQYPIYVSHGDPREMLELDITAGAKGHHQEKTSPALVRDFVRSSGGVFGLRTGPTKFEWTPSSGVWNDCPGSSKSFAQALAAMVDEGTRVAISLDANGFAKQLVPRYDVESPNWLERLLQDEGLLPSAEDVACLGDVAGQQGQNLNNMMADDPATPHTDESDYNRKGLGHFGLLGAFLRDLQYIGLQPEYRQHLASSAESFVQMWETAD